MKYNYPVKYAAMPIIEPIGWNHGLERHYDVVCYIVSKCYLLSEKIKYEENGKRLKEYEVVFPYHKGQYNSWERVIPEFNFTNSVDKVFDNYEEALEFVAQKNKELCDKTWAYLPYTEDLNNRISEKKQEFNDRLSKYKIMEQQILINTSDLEQSNVKELNKLIINSKDKIKLLSCNLYEYLKISSTSDFIVYSVSPEQYEKLVALVNAQDVCDLSRVIGNVSPILYNDSKNKNIMVIDENCNVLYYLNEWEGLIEHAEQEMPSVELKSTSDNIECLFTTETLKDIVLSFKKHKNINPDEIQGPILKKTLFDRNKKYL